MKRIGIRRQASRPFAASSSAGASYPRRCGQGFHIRSVALFVVSLCVLYGCRNRTPEARLAQSKASEPTSEAPSETVQSETRFTSLALGESHSCALHDSGRVFCWGHNHLGQVGNDSKEEMVPIPTEVLGVENAVQVVATGSYTCARTTSGDVWCWGGGIGRTAKRVEGLAKPATDVVVCDGYYGCARHEGEVSCWGSQYVNRADGTPLLPSDTAVMIPDLHDATGLACQGAIACARRGQLDALCWGATEGDGMLATSAVTEIAPLPPFQAPQAAESSFRAMSSCRDGACWSLAPSNDDKAFPLMGLEEIAHSDNIGCTLRTGGYVTCEGHADFGAAGETDRAGALLGVRARALAVGERHACVLDKKRGILCWGDNERAQLGDGTWGEAVPTPQKISGLSNLRDLRASRRWTDWPMQSVMLAASADSKALEQLQGWQWRGIAVTQEKQELVWWGGTRRAIGSGKNPPMTQADLNGEEICASTKNGLACAALTKGDLDWKPISKQRFDQISAGGHHFCGRDDSGDAWCWGSNAKGALGDGGTIDRSAPVSVKGLGKIATIAAGDAHSCALDVEGSVSCWGKNSQGRLGDGTTDSRRIPTKVRELDDVVDVSVGKDTSCAVRKNGEVSCWGRRFTGMRLGPKRVAVAAATEVAVGCDHACSRTSAGQVQCWGGNEYGQLGAVPGTLDTNPDGESRGALWMRSYLGPSTVAGLPPVKRLAAGCNGTCAETLTGEVYCWGHRATIGDGEASFRFEAKPIAEPKGGWPVCETECR